MSRLSQKIRASSSQGEVFAALADEIRAVTEGDHSAVYMLNKETRELVLAGVSGLDPGKMKALPRIEVDEDFRRRVSAPGQPLVMRMDRPEDIPKAASELAKALDIGSLLLCPIVLRNELMGYMVVTRVRGGGPFSPNAEKMLESVSAGAGMQLENVRIYSTLTKEKERTERILTLAPIGILICDPKGIFQSLNRQMLNMLDRESSSELIGTSVFEIPAIDKSGIDALLLQGMEGHEGEKSDVHLVLRSDKALYLHVKVTPVKSERGEVESLLLVAMDVTSKVRLQNQLERSYEKLTQTYQELERVTKMKTQFIDIVSHELRTPLTVMRGYIDLVESEYSSKLDPKFASRLRTIKTNTDKLYGLVENMLDVSRLEKGSMQIHPEPVRIDTILEELVHVRVHDAEEKRQVLTLDVEGRLPLIMADRRRLKDVFNSLIDNSLKYTQEGGRIHVSARDEGRMIHVWVKDNGVGIPLENLGKIFDRFHIVTSNDLSHQVDRLGLGLPISKGIVEAHGGRIWVESQVGKGSVFHVDLPKEQQRIG
jgi:PAS domain S-box-containing protein